MREREVIDLGEPDFFDRNDRPGFTGSSGHPIQIRFRSQCDRWTLDSSLIHLRPPPGPICFWYFHSISNLRSQDMGRSNNVFNVNRTFG